jgi:hypothetical protein
MEFLVDADVEVAGDSAGMRLGLAPERFKGGGDAWPLPQPLFSENDRFCSPAKQRP